MLVLGFQKIAPVFLASRPVFGCHTTHQETLETSNSDTARGEWNVHLASCMCGCVNVDKILPQAGIYENFRKSWDQLPTSSGAGFCSINCNIHWYNAGILNISASSSCKLHFNRTSALAAAMTCHLILEAFAMRPVEVGFFARFYVQAENPYYNDHIINSHVIIIHNQAVCTWWASKPPNLASSTLSVPTMSPVCSTSMRSKGPLVASCNNPTSRWTWIYYVSIKLEN